MSDLKPTSVQIELGGKTYGLRFTLNAIDDIQEHFDTPISDLGEIMQDERNSIKNIRYLLAVLINEDIDYQNDESDKKIPRVDERYIGRRIDSANMKTVMSSIFESFTAGAPKPSDDDIPNAASE